MFYSIQGRTQKKVFGGVFENQLPKELLFNKHTKFFLKIRYT